MFFFFAVMSGGDIGEMEWNIILFFEKKVECLLSTFIYLEVFSRQYLSTSAISIAEFISPLQLR